MRVESAVGAFLYDLADGPNDPDSRANTADGDESFDTAVYEASWIANTMQGCTLDGISQLDGADQLVYCLERRTNPGGAFSESRRFSTAWRSYSSASFESIPPPTGFNADVVRKLWKFNMYGVLEDPPAGGTATISGRTSVRPNATCLWDASTTLASPPYAYSWTVNGVPVGNNSSSLTHTAGSTSFIIRVSVTNTRNEVASDDHEVTVTSSTTACVF